MSASDDARLIYAIAIRLGKWPGEVIDRPLEELRGLAAFLDWQAEAAKPQS